MVYFRLIVNEKKKSCFFFCKNSYLILLSYIGILDFRNINLNYLLQTL